MSEDAVYFSLTGWELSKNSDFPWHGNFLKMKKEKKSSINLCYK